MNGTDYHLVEFSPIEGYVYIRNAMDDIRSLGYYGKYYGKYYGNYGDDAE